MRIFYALFCFFCVAVVSFFGFRGIKSTQPPIYVFPDMDWQAKYKTQEENFFFADHRDDRPIVPGSVPRGNALDVQAVFTENYTYLPDENPALFTGKNEDGSFYRGFPLPITHRLMALGREKFNIFCAVCHHPLGSGDGVTKQYGMVATPSYHDDRLRQMAEGEIFNTITHGKNTMLPYADKLRPQERWAVIAYVRALQRAANATLQDVPQEHLSDLGL